MFHASNFLNFLIIKCLFFFLLQEEDQFEKTIEDIQSIYPIVIIKGSSCYEVDSKCYIVWENKIIVQGKGVLKGVLCLFLCYFVYGIEYAKKQQKILEFIQR